MDKVLEDWIKSNYPKHSDGDESPTGKMSTSDKKKYTYASFDGGRTYYGPIPKEDLEEFKKKHPGCTKDRQIKIKLEKGVYLKSEDDK